MTAKEIKLFVGDTPHMSLEQAETLTKFISDNNISSILELGFRHGVSTCYMAGALAESEKGSITTIDLEPARLAEPNVEDLLQKIGLREKVLIFYEPTSYIWRLMKFLEENPSPKFDFCYLDGAHNWFTDGFAFFLVDRMLKPGGWIILDDLDWTYATSPALKDTDFVKKMPQEEKEEPQVRKVYDLLIKTHPSYNNFKVDKGWAYAQKKMDTTLVMEREVVVERVLESPIQVIKRFGTQLKNLIP